MNFKYELKKLIESHNMDVMCSTQSDILADYVYDNLNAIACMNARLAAWARENLPKQCEEVDQLMQGVTHEEKSALTRADISDEIALNADHTKSERYSPAQAERIILAQLGEGLEAGKED